MRGDIIIGLLADSAAVALATVTIAVSFLRRSSRYRQWSLGIPLRRSVHRDETYPSVAELATLLEVPQRRRNVVAALQSASQKMLAGDNLTPGDAVADLLPGGQGGVSSASRSAGLLRTAYANSARGSNTSLLAKLLYPEDVTQVAAFHKDLARALEPFAMSVAVPPDRSHATPSLGSSFVGFVTALSGAPVLVDASAMRSRHADGVLTWHRRHYRDGTGEPSSEGYLALHTSGPCQTWRTATRPPGDFDRRMLDLRSVALLESSAQGRTSFGLGTWETCYAATESGWEHGCKKVPADHMKHDPSVDPVFSQASHQQTQRPASRLTLLTSYVSVITSDGWLALVRRSAAVRNGVGVVSASAGGIVEIDEPGPSGDTSSVGLPDPLVTASRETGEEIGLDLPPDCIKPVAVFLANVRERTTQLTGQGQLVGVVLSLARSEMSLEQLQLAAETKSDLSKGRFEWDEFVPCPTNSVTAMATWARATAPDLDQHGLLSVVYTAMTLFGAEETRRAFEAEFWEGPWWCGPASGAAPYRVCRDPGPMVGMETEHLLAAVSAQWAEAWRQSLDGTSTASPRPD